jgi:hypothetical protein
MQGKTHTRINFYLPVLKIATRVPIYTPVKKMVFLSDVADGDDFKNP